ncbi:hypothetical protein [Sporosarcina koreensis]|uniref:hypothetical protein n=1 Tax=Sporosarcina koreensis TaxID=334735 RepID=UPI000A731AE1|nr:hypothetical protein [Sporosarcina koreensis]
MKAVYVSPSRETEKRILIDQLNQLGIYENLKGEPLEQGSYHTLRTMLATKKAVAQ